MSKGTAVLGRVAAAVEEAILEHELSERELERLSGVSRWWIHRLVSGERVRPDVLIRLASVILVLAVTSPARPVSPVPAALDEALAERLAPGTPDEETFVPLVPIDEQAFADFVEGRRAA
jgi:hypothetical protein